MLVNPLWRPDNPGILYKKHTAIGNQADVDSTGPVNSLLGDLIGVGTASYPLNIQEVFTGTPATYSTGLSIKSVGDFSSAPVAILGTEALAATASGNSQNAAIMAGFYGGSRHSGTGTISNVYGVPTSISNTSSGNITTATGLYASVGNSGSGTVTNSISVQADAATNSGGGTITNAYGLYLANQTAGTTNYNMYSSGLASRNYFGGYVETSSAGGFYLGTSGSVNNRFLLNAYLASDSTAEQINTPSSTARKALVLQMNSGQTANALEIQDNSGTLMTNFTPGGSLTFAGSRTFTAQDSIIKASGTYTANYTAALSPAGYDFNSTLIFSQDGFAFGSGIMFYGRPTIQNSSGSTRSIGPWLGVLINPTYQANGGTFSGQAMDFAANAIFNRINSGTLSFTNHYNFWGQGGTVDTGATVTNRYGFYYSDSGTINGTLTSSTAFAANTINGTNKTYLLLGTNTIPSGTWGIYQSSTEANLFNGVIQMANGSASTPSLSYSGDTNTGLHWVGADQFSLDAGGVSRMQVSSVEVVVNPGKVASNDFRVHGDTVDSLIFADVSADALGFFNTTPIAKYATTGTTTGFTAGVGTAVNDDSTFTGNTGSTAYTIGDIVRALKLYGLLTS